jgi:hypothetical protein
MLQRIDETSVQAILNQAKRQKRHALIVKTMVWFFMILSFIICPIWSLYLLMGGVGPLLFSENPSYILPVIMVLVYGSFFIIPLLLCLPVVLSFAIKRSDASRIVVLRKFNKRESTVSLGRIIRTSLAGYGHVFTLSDKGFRIKWYVRIPVILGQMSFFHFRQRTIEKPAQLERLKQALEQKVWLNINWLFSSSKVFSVKTTDNYWQDTVTTLLQDTGLIVFDVSEFTASQEWETKKIIDLKLQHRMIVLAADQQQQSALAWKEKFDVPDDDYDIPVFYYDARGRLLDPTGFEESIAANLAQRPPQEHPNSIRELYANQSVRTAGIAMAFFLILLFLLSPIILPGLTGRHTPFPRQAVRAYIQSLMHHSDDSLSMPIQARIRKLWPQKGAALSIHYAYHHEPAECVHVAMALKGLADPSKTADYITLIKKGEPLMADTAFSALKGLKPANTTDIALDLIAQPRIDTREKGLDLLWQDKLNDQVIRRLIHQLDNDRVAISPAPFQHKAHEGLFRSKPPYGRPFRDRLVLYQLELYRLLLGHMPAIRDELLANSATANNDFSMIKALLLLADHNGSGITQLFDQRFLTIYYPAALHEIDSTLYVDARRPFQEITDTLLTRNAHWEHLPDYATIIACRDRLSNAAVPVSLLQFLVQNYSRRALADFTPYIDAKSLAGFLYLKVKGSRQDLAFYDSLVLTNREAFNSRLDAKDADIEGQLKIAWCLAHAGDARGLETAVRASRITKAVLLIFPTHPYKEQAHEVLSELNKAPRVLYDKASLLRLKDSLSAGMTELMDDLMLKAKG